MTIDPHPNNEISGEFDGVQEICDAAIGGIKNSFNRSIRDYFFERHKNDRWLCAERTFATVPEAIAAVRVGNFQAGAERIERLVEKVEPPIAMDVRRRARWADQGDEIDQQKVWGGNLETAWRRVRRESTRGPQRIRVAVPIIASAGVRSEAMAWRGVAGVALADRLSAAGHSVEIVAISKGNLIAVGNPRSLVTVIVKPYEQPVDIASLANVVASSLFFRAAVHCWAWSVSALRCQSGGFMPLSLEDKDCVSARANRVFRVPESCRSEATVSEWLTTQIEAINAEALGELAA